MLTAGALSHLDNIGASSPIFRNDEQRPRDPALKSADRHTYMQIAVSDVQDAVNDLIVGIDLDKLHRHTFPRAASRPAGICINLYRLVNE